jgi:signal transduction histidine kinase
MLRAMALLRSIPPDRERMQVGAALTRARSDPPAARRARCRCALLVALAPLLLAFTPQHLPVEARLEEAWRWRTIDGPDGAATVFHFVRPGSEGELLALDDKGLLAFDGWNWRREAGWTSLVDLDVRDIAPLPDGVAVLADGLVKTVDVHGQWADIDRYASPAFVSQFCRNADGTVDLAINRTIMRVGLQALQPLMPSPDDDSKSLSLARDATGALWCAGEEGVYRQIQDHWVRMSPGALSRGLRVWYRQAVRSGGSLVFLPERLDATTTGVIWNGSELAPLRPGDEAFKISDAAPTPDGSIIVATSGPKLRVLREGRWHEVQVPLPTQENVESLALTDGEQLAMVFASGRLAICDLASNEWEAFDTGAAGVGESVNVIAPSSAGGFWIGTDDGYVTFDGENFGKPVREALDMPLSEITGLCEDPDGGLWVGSGSGFKGVYRIKDNRWTRYAEADNVGDFFVHRIRRTGDELWLTLIGDPLGVFKAGGLVRWKDGAFERFMEEDDGTNLPRSYDVLQRHDGTLVAGLAGSLRRFDHHTWLPDPTAPLGGRSAWVLHESPDDVLWVGFGLSIPGVAQLTGNTWRRLDSGSWQRAAAASFAETPDGRLWFASEKGLFLALEDECREVSGRLPMRTFWPVHSDGKGGLWLGTLGEGLLHFTPRDVQPPVFREIDVHFGEQGDVVARWVAVDRWNATPSEELSFRVLMDGKPAEATAWVSGQQAVFRPLSSGPHELRVTAIDSMGNPSSEPAVHQFSVPPPWWRSLPVLLAAGAIAAVLLWLLIVIRNRRRERAVAAAAQRELNERLSSLTLRLLSTQEDERRNISREMHDDLGQLLTAACLDIERATRLSDPDRRREALHSALRAARDTQQRVREISHMLRPTELDDHGLPQAVATIITDFITRSGIDVESNIQVEARALPTDVANHVFRILQEALTNILRHARAATAFVTLQATHAGIELKVSDDGVGFEEETIPPSRRYGLLGMRERAELLGGKFSIRSKPEGGTEVSVSIPIPHR